MNASGQENQRSVPPLCVNSCGFYGNPTTKNFCSKCYRDFIKLEEQKNSNIQLSTRSHQGLSSELTNNIKNTNSNTAPLNYSSGNTSLINDSYNINVTSNSNLPIFTRSSFDGSVSSISLIPEGKEERLSTVSESSSGFNSNNSPSTLVDMSKENESINLDSRIDNHSKAFSLGQVDSSRCSTCKKKIGLLGFKCRCGFYFCGPHRDADSHNCSFDYKGYGRAQLSKNNQKVVVEKIERI